MARRCMLCLIFLMTPFTVSFASMGNVKYIFNYANQRFQMMRSVAAYKYVNRLPVNITIPERVESRSLFRYINQRGLNAKSSRPLITTNQLIGKHVQLHWINQWRQKGLSRNEKIKNLQKVLMPALLKLDKKMIDSIVLAVPTLRDSKNLKMIKRIGNQELNAKYLTQQDKAAYMNALLQIKLK